MSHFTYIRTRFQNLVYLKNSLTKLGITYKVSGTNLTMSQSNNSNLEFAWNGHEYELAVDLSFWEQPYPIEIFIDKVSQQYAAQFIIGENRKIGFELIESKVKATGTNTLVLQRYS